MSATKPLQTTSHKFMQLKPTNNVARVFIFISETCCTKGFQNASSTPFCISGKVTNCCFPLCSSLYSYIVMYHCFYFQLCCRQSIWECWGLHCKYFMFGGHDPQLCSRVYLYNISTTNCACWSTKSCSDSALR